MSRDNTEAREIESLILLQKKVFKIFLFFFTSTVCEWKEFVRSMTGIASPAAFSSAIDELSFVRMDSSTKMLSRFTKCLCYLFVLLTYFTVRPTPCLGLEELARQYLQNKFKKNIYNSVCFIQLNIIFKNTGN